MIFKLYNSCPVEENVTPTERILINRGMKKEDIPKYLNLSDKNIYSYNLLDNIEEAFNCFKKHVERKSKIKLVVDCDADGFVSSSTLLNWAQDVWGEEIYSFIDFFIHDGKKHGIFLEETNYFDYDLIICPDSSSNDFEEHERLAAKGIDIIVLDHHETDHVSEHAIVVNNQLCDYPNKHLCGAGIVYKFCQYGDTVMKTNYADNYIDLVALGLVSDMMSLLSFETKYLIDKGLNSIKNPYFYEMTQKNSYSLGDKITPMGVAFYVTPFINAHVRSGTIEEQTILFKSMLMYYAFNKVPSTKRGCKGQEERLVDQAVRNSTNVKKRQTKAQDEGMAFLEKTIKRDNLLDNKVLLFCIAEGQIDKNIAGLVANKLSPKYQRPTCILIKHEENGKIYYSGSARGCDIIGVTDFKQICWNTGVVDYAEGHPGAFGTQLPAANIEEFLRITNENLKDISDEPVYYVDYIYEGQNVNKNDILEIASLDSFWGKDIDESLIAIQNLRVNKENVALMSANKNPTLKITLNNGISIIKFRSSQEEYEKFATDTYNIVNIIGKSRINEWYGNITAQVLIDDYEIVGVQNYYF